MSGSEAPDAACPRCEAMREPRSESCAVCGLRFACEQCRMQYRDPARQRFCASCRAPVRQPGWRGDSVGRAGPDVTAQSRSDPTHEEHDAPFAFLRHSRRAGDDDEGDGGHEAERPGWGRTRRLFRGVGRRALPIRELYVQLGEALVDAERFEEASEMFHRALGEAKGSGEEAEILESLASALARSEADPVLRAGALRAGLEAARRDPGMAGRVLARLRRLADADALALEGDWILRDWYAELEAQELDPRARVECRLLAARAAFRLDEYPRALELLGEAAEIDPDAARSSGRHLFEPSPLPAGLIDADPGYSHWLQAQANSALQLDESALDEVDLSLSDGFALADADLRPAALELKADLLERADRRDEAADVLTDAGRSRADGADYARAAALLERAVALSPSPAGYWYLADFRRLVAIRPDYPYVDQADIKAARRAWDDGRKLGAPTPDVAWAYLVSAVIHEDTWPFSEDGRECTARAAAAVEQALALDDWRADAWAYLARYARLLDIDAEAILAAQHAVDLDPDHPVAAEEMIFANAFLALPGALDAIDRHRDVLADADARIRSVRGYYLALEGDYEESFRELDTAVRGGETNLWSLLYRALAAGLSGRVEKSLTDFERLRAETAPGGPAGLDANRDLQAWSLFGLDRHVEAAALFAELLDTPETDAVDMRAGLGCSRLFAGDTEGAVRYLDDALGRVRNRNQVLSVRCRLDAVLARAEELGAGRELAQSFRERCSARAEEEAARVYDPGLARKEWAAARESAAAGSASWLAATAALARRALADFDWDQAARAYESIIEAVGDDAFPEARPQLVGALRRQEEQARLAGDAAGVESALGRLEAIGVASAHEKTVAVAEAYEQAGSPEDANRRLDTLPDTATELGPALGLRAGDLLLRLGRLDDAEAVYTAALDEDVEHEVRRGVLAGCRDDTPTAIRRLRRALALYEEVGVWSPGWYLWQACRSAVGPARNRGVDAAIRALTRDPTTGEVDRRELAVAHLQRGDEERPATVSPLAIDMDPSILQDKAGVGIGLELLEHEIPTLRERVRSATGVVVPGVRLRGRAELAGIDADYLILFNEVPYAAARLPAGSVLCTDADAAGRLGLHGPPLLFGEEVASGAVWLDRHAAAVAATHGLDVLSPAAAVAWHLERLVRDHAHLFVGVSEVDHWLTDWRNDGGDARQRLATAAVPDLDALVRFAVVLRELAKEQIPLDLEPILHAFERAGPSDDPAATAESMRADLAPLLARRSAGRRHVQMPPTLGLDLERLALAESPASPHELVGLADELLAALGGLGEPLTRDDVLVVHDKRVRATIRRIVAARLPTVPVLSAIEIEAAAAESAREASSEPAPV